MDLDITTLESVDWFNHRRIYHDLGRMPPAEFETNKYRHTGPVETTESLAKQHHEARDGSHLIPRQSRS